MPTPAKTIEQTQETALPHDAATETTTRFDAQRPSRRDTDRSRRDVAGGATVAGPPKSLVREYFESAVVTIIMALFGMTFIVQAVKVPTGSMQNTINIGDQLLVNKFIFAPGPPLPFLPQREIRRGDVIVFKYPGNPHDTTGRDKERDNIPYRTNYVKRVVGLPGETVEVRGDEVYINRNLLPERRVSVATPSVGDDPALQIVQNPPPSGEGAYTVFYSQEMRESLRRGEEVEALPNSNYARAGAPTLIPEGYYFAMGDNRENSEDGRVWGLVPRNLIVGRAMFVYWSYDLSDVSDDNPLVKFLRNSRWERAGTMIK